MASARRTAVRIVLFAQLAAIVVLVALIGVRVGALANRMTRIADAQDDIVVALRGLTELERTAATVESLEAVISEMAGLTDTVASNTGRIDTGVQTLVGTTRAVESNVTSIRSAAEPILTVVSRINARRSR